MFPSVREVLALPSVRHGAPKVVAGAAGLDRPVRWVHVAEVPDIAELLRGGELVLLTGIGLPADDDGLRRFVTEVAEVGVCGLVVELGRRFRDRVPAVMVHTAERLGLPLVELHRATRFVPVTEAVHALIIDAQLAELRATEEIHQRFTELSVEGAAASEVVAEVAALAGAPVVLENLARQVLAHHAAGEDAALLLDGWEAHSRTIPQKGRTHHASGWLATTVGARGQDWGRLLVRTPQETTRLVILVERAASTLALGRLIQRDAEDLERQTHRSLLTALLDHSRPVDEVVLRARALGVPLDRKHLIGVVVRLTERSGDGETDAPALRDLGAATAQALRDERLTGLTGLVSAIDEHTVGALLALRDEADEAAALERFARRLRLSSRSVTIAAGTGVSSPREARRSLNEARQVADAARAGGVTARPVHRLPDVGLAGLLHLLRDEPRLQTFVDRELGSLLSHDAAHPKEQLLGTLRAYLRHGRNKSAAAEAAHLSRPAFYERLARISRILDKDLDAVDPCLSLHVALLALDAIRRPAG